MTLLNIETLQRIREGQLTLGFGVHHLRGPVVPLLAKAAGYDWLFIDSEHGAISTQEISQLCVSSLSTGIAPIVRVCRNALDEGTRALDNGALGIIVPHIDTADDAKQLVEAFRFPPIGRRSIGGAPAQFGYRPPPVREMQDCLNREILLIPMIETLAGVENVDSIAAVEGIDALLIGTNDLTLEMGIAGQIGHERVETAYRKIAQACYRYDKIFGMGGVYDQEWATHYIKMGARFVLAGSDHSLLLQAATNRSEFLRQIVLNQDN